MKVRDCTSMFIPSGPQLSIHIGRASFDRKEVVENILGSIECIVDKLPGKWKNVQNICISTHDSVALPIYKALPMKNKTKKNKIDVKSHDDSCEEKKSKVRKDVQASKSSIKHTKKRKRK